MNMKKFDKLMQTVDEDLNSNQQWFLMQYLENKIGVRVQTGKDLIQYQEV